MWFIIMFNTIVTAVISVVQSDSKNKAAAGIMGTIAGAIVGWIIGYWCMPSMVGPFWGMTGSVFACLVVSGVIGFIGTENQDAPPKISIIGIAIMLILLLITGFGSTSCVQSGDQYAMLAADMEEVEYTDEMKPIDPIHMRTVSKAQAKWLAGKALGEIKGGIGSRYKIGEMAIQKIKDDGLYWIAPLEFQGFWKWWAHDITSGYVKVSAEDRKRPVEVIDGFEFKFVLTSCWSKDLIRHLYNNGFSGYQLEEPTFEIDDEGNPFWVISLVQPTEVFTCEKVVGVAIIDPITGDITKYEMDEIPEWVDRVIPEYLAEKYLEWWGLYGEGWLNATFFGAEENCYKPTPYRGSAASDVYLTFGDDGQTYWVTGITSTKSSDDSLCSMAMVNSRTGKLKMYNGITGCTERAALQVVDAAVSNYSSWHGEDPILYNVYGEPSFVCPIVADNILQGIAIVRISDSTVVIGKDKRGALQKYRIALAKSGDTIAPSSTSSAKRITRKITRISADVRNGTTNYLVLLDGKMLFVGTWEISRELPLAREGDMVTINFFQTTEAEVPITTFDIHGIDLQKSAAQTQAEAIDAKPENRIKTKQETRNLRKKVSNMTDEELKAMMKK